MKAAVVALFLSVAPFAYGQMSADDPALKETIECWALQLRAQESLLDLTILSNLKEDDFLKQYNELEDRIDSYTRKLLSEKVANGMAVVANTEVNQLMAGRQKLILEEVETLVKNEDVRALQVTLTDANLCAGAIS